MDFDAVMLARIQFAFTISFHIIFPSFTIGLAAFIVLLWFLTDALLPFVLGAALAYLTDPLADRLERAGLSRLLATVVITVVSLGVAVLALGFDRPLTLLILSATLNGFVMFLYSGLLLWLNVRCLRGPLRPSPLRVAALVGAFGFFGYFSVLTLLDQLARLG